MADRIVRGALTVLVLSSFIASCSSGETDPGPPVALDAGFIPGAVLDLAVDEEPLPAGVAEVSGSLLSEVALFSLRSGDQLAASLQVGRLRDQDRATSDELRAGVLEQVGATRPTAAQVGSHEVWLTSSNEQLLAVWFSDDHLFVLSIRPEFDQPRALIRAAATIDPGGA